MHRYLDVGKGGSTNVALAIVAICFHERLRLRAVFCGLSRTAVKTIAGNSTITTTMFKAGQGLCSQRTPFGKYIRR